MFRFSQHSLNQLKTVYPPLQQILIRTLVRHDFRLDEAERSTYDQQAAFDSGHSKLAPPDGKHLARVDPTGQYPQTKWAFAVDICPYINGKRLATDRANFGPEQKAQFAFFLCTLRSVAEYDLRDTGWSIRLGINWDGDEEILTDQTFDDWFHVEIVRG